MTEQNTFSISELQQQANAGDAQAQFALGLYYSPTETKEGWEFKDKLYQDYLLDSIGGPSIDPKIFSALEAAENNKEINDELAFMWFEKAAEQGNMGSQYAVARCYFEGKGTEQSDDLAFKWAEKSSHQGFGEAFELLGDLFREGRGVDQDNKSALGCYEKAAIAGVKGAVSKRTNMLLMWRDIADFSKSKEVVLKRIEKMQDIFNDAIDQHLPLIYGSGYDENNPEPIDEFVTVASDLFHSLVVLSKNYTEGCESLEKKIVQQEKELEDMMSMFAHKFRSPLDAIIYNTSHDNNPKLYAEAAQTMRGLLDIFSIISTDEKILTEKIKADCQGNAHLNTVLSKTLNMILLHLLSVSGTEKIHQHYLAYAKAHGKVAASVTDKEWYDEHFELEQALQAEWEQDFAALLSQSAPLAERLAWLEQHFFKLELIGFDRDDIQFKEYAVTESLLTILLNEILVNAFKYYSSETRQAVVLEWSERDGKQILSCRNPSIRRERDVIKGSGKGHTFLSALARKIGGQFTKPKPQDDFVLEFGIPDELLVSNS
ncbi:tetratricopeptide repeat protein [Methylovulum miyakonense]|uniref:tetratricopeptide repeat protein n=1 Tax=Methylovulum miyakonense TaxID=645578 RepID=UPI0018DDDF86|nr:tetratricopeptide repeat protein [Methylovulum miyakonense]